MNKLLIDCQHIDKSYLLGKTKVTALRDINFQVQHGEYIAILGPSGSGKSTLMNILGCLDVPTQGNYILDDRDVSHLSRNELAWVRNRKIGFIFQNFNLLAHATALENVALPLIYRGLTLQKAKAQAAIWLTKVGLEERLNHMPNELSGGQRQRVAIARAFVTEPDLLLADEPTGNLDTQTGQEIMSLFESFISQGKTILIITHDLNLAKRAHRIVNIRDGELLQ